MVQRFILEVIQLQLKGDKYANEKVKDAIEYLIKRFRSDKKIDEK